MLLFKPGLLIPQGCTILHDDKTIPINWLNWLFQVQTVRLDLSDYKDLNRTVKQPIKIKHFMPLANKL